MKQREKISCFRTRMSKSYCVWTLFSSEVPLLFTVDKKPTNVRNVQPSHQDKMLALTFVQTTDTSTFLCAYAMHLVDIPTERIISRSHYASMIRLSYQGMKRVVVEVQARRLPNQWQQSETVSTLRSGTPLSIFNKTSVCGDQNIVFTWFMSPDLTRQ